MNPRALRRTLAMAIAQRPHGLMAAKVHLKHVSVAAFTAQIAVEEEAEHMRLTVAAFEDYQRGDLPSGPGARDLIASFQAADQVLNRHDPGPVNGH